jgi:enoyl-CoA hydratase/carnithine racemase
MQKTNRRVTDGKVAGLGLDIAAASDHRIATEKMIISDGRIQNAEHVATGITHILPRLIGLSQATRILLLGDELTAIEASRIGLIHAVYASDDFTDQAARFVDKISTLATRSYSIIKEQTIEQLDMPYEWALKHSLAIRQTNVIEDRVEAAAAFKEKREPKFSGR